MTTTPTDHPAPALPRTPRRAVRTAVLAATTAAVVMAPGVAHAVPAEGWPEAPEVSALRLIVTVVLIPLGLALVLGVAFALPGLAADRSKKSGSSLPATWMGGPKQGTDSLPAESSAVDDTGSDARGGSSARW